MIAIGHTATGVLVGLAGVTLYESGVLPAPAVIPLVLLAGIGAHYAGDWLPHGHYQFDLRKRFVRSALFLSVDLIIPFLTLATLAYLAFGREPEWWLIVLGMAGANLPDLYEELVNLKILPVNSFAREHRSFHYDKIHWHRASTNPLPNGSRRLSWIDTYQLLLFGLAVWVLRSAIL